ncbi:gas vesicle protein GvpJ [Streptomyces sp. NPDC057287]|uniref:gas vesicle protein GvpJ n=1 Tax=Streptomyces sp. NPDC057287 TaxID=3346086 RepID=UPI00362F454D
MSEPFAAARMGGPAAASLTGQQQGSSANLADILERVLDKGIVIAGDIQINLLDIELLTIKLRLLVASVDKAKEMGIDWWENDPSLSSRAPRPAGREVVPDQSQQALEIEQLRAEVAQLRAAQTQSPALGEHGPEDARERVDRWARHETLPDAEPADRANEPVLEPPEPAAAHGEEVRATGAAARPARRKPVRAAPEERAARSAAPRRPAREPVARASGGTEAQEPGDDVPGEPARRTRRESDRRPARKRTTQSAEEPAGGARRKQPRREGDPEQ